MSRLDPLLRTLSLAPSNQINEKMTAKIARLVGCSNEIVATELKEIYLECRAKSLATPFATGLISQAIEVAETRD